MKKIFFIAALILGLSISPHIFANQIIPGKQIESLTVQEVESVLAGRGETRRHELDFFREIEDITLPNGVIDIKIVLPNSVSYSGMTSVRARIYLGGRVYRDINFTVTLKVFDKVIVANHDLRVEVPVTPSDFRIEEVTIDGREEYCKNIKEVVGLVPHRYIRAGSPVAKNYFQQPVAVDYGSPVRIIVRYNGLEASAKGTALSRGRIGQVIKVRNDASQKVLSAKIIDSQTVEVIY